MSSAGIVWVDRARVLDEARAIARRLREHQPEIQRVVLIGSFARGGGGPRSDIDLVLFVHSTPLAPRDRPAHYAPASTRPVDLIVYTRDEVERDRPVRSPAVIGHAAIPCAWKRSRRALESTLVARLEGSSDGPSRLRKLLLIGSIKADDAKGWPRCSRKK